MKWMNPKQKKKWKKAVAKVIQQNDKNPDDFDGQDWGLAMHIWKKMRESMEPYRMHSILREANNRISTLAEAAPMGAVVEFEGDVYKKGSTDQPTWIPVKQGGGLVAVIPQEDDTYFPKIEKAWMEQDKAAKDRIKSVKDRAAKRDAAIAKLSPEEKAKYNELLLKTLKAPLSKKAALIKKADKLLGL